MVADVFSEETSFEWSATGTYTPSTGAAGALVPAADNTSFTRRHGITYQLNSDAAKLAAGGTGAVNPANDPALAANDLDWIAVDAPLKVDSHNDLDALVVPADYDGHVQVVGNDNEPESKHQVVRTGAITSLERIGFIPMRKTLLTGKSLGLSPATTNNRLQLDKFKAYITELGGAEIVLDGGEYSWANPFTSVPNLHLEGAGEDTVIKLSSATSRIMRAAANGSLTNMIIDYAGFGSTYGIDIEDDAHNFCIDSVNFIDSSIVQEKIDSGVGLSARLASAMPINIVVGACNDVKVLNVTGENVGTMVAWSNNATNAIGSKRGIQRNVRHLSPARQASLSTITWHTEDLKIEDVFQGMYDTNILGGHAIAMQGEGDPAVLLTPNTSIKRTIIKCITVHGRPDVGWLPALANGAHGDMIAVRCSENTSITDYELKDGGEFGIDDIHGAVNTFIGTGTIERMDGSGIISGGDSQFGEPAVNTIISNATVIDCGLDHEGVPGDALGFSSIAGIRLWSTLNPKITGCRVEGCKGAAVYITNAPNQDVVAVDIGTSNTFKDNGTQALGYDPVWSGQLPAFGWDGSALSEPAGTGSVQTHTGSVHGIASVNGDGGVFAARDAQLKALGWQVEGVAPIIDVVRNGTKHLKITAATYTGLVNGYVRKFSFPATDPIVFSPIRSDSFEYAPTSDVDNMNSEHIAGALNPATTACQVLKLWLNPVLGKYYLQYGSTGYSSVTTTGVYQYEYDKTPDFAASADMIYLGRVLVSTASATNFNAVNAGQVIEAWR